MPTWHKWTRPFRCISYSRALRAYICRGPQRVGVTKRIFGDDTIEGDFPLFRASVHALGAHGRLSMLLSWWYIVAVARACPRVGELSIFIRFRGNCASQHPIQLETSFNRYIGDLHIRTTRSFSPLWTANRQVSLLSLSLYKRSVVDFWKRFFKTHGVCEIHVIDHPVLNIRLVCHQFRLLQIGVFLRVCEIDDKIMWANLAKPVVITFCESHVRTICTRASWRFCLEACKRQLRTRSDVCFTCLFNFVGVHMTDLFYCRLLLEI